MATPVGSRQRSPLRAVAVPTEHGGWSFTLEPALLGLLVAPSGAGALLALAALLAFVARTPLRLVLVDRRRRRRLPRTALAERVAAIELLSIAGLGIAVLATAGTVVLAPLALAAPLVALELWFASRSRSRRLLPELAGTIALGSVATAVALAGGAEAETAWALWLVVAARDVATVPFVRAQVRRVTGRPHDRRTSDVAQLAAVVVVMAGLAAGVVPIAAALVIAAIAAFGLVAVRLAAPKVGIIGAQQVVLGLTMVVTAGLGFAMP